MIFAEFSAGIFVLLNILNGACKLPVISHPYCYFKLQLNRYYFEFAQI